MEKNNNVKNDSIRFPFSVRPILEEVPDMEEMSLEELFREAKGVVQFADVIVLLHRERGEGVKRKALAIVAQAPNGKNGVVTMQYNSENQQFKIADTCEKL